MSSHWYAKDHDWFTGGTSRMTLSAGGNLNVTGGINSTAIGATTPSTGAFTMVTGSAASAPFLATNTTGGVLQYRFTTAGATNVAGLGSNSAGEIVFQSNTVNSVLISATGLAVTGGITATGNITAYYSDDRLKTRGENIPSAVDKVLSLNGFFYEANETAQVLGYEKKREIGVSAQEVEAVLPELIQRAPISDQAGVEYKTLDYGRLVPLLIEAIKEQQVQINSLQNQLNLGN